MASCLMPGHESVKKTTDSANLHRIVADEGSWVVMHLLIHVNFLPEPRSPRPQRADRRAIVFPHYNFRCRKDFALRSVRTRTSALPARGNRLLKLHQYHALPAIGLIRRECAGKYLPQNAACRCFRYMDRQDESRWTSEFIATFTAPASLTWKSVSFE